LQGADRKRKRRKEMFADHRYFAAKADFRKWPEEARDREAADRLHAQACADSATRYQGVFAGYNEAVPEAGADPNAYRCRLMRDVRSKLSRKDGRRIDSAGTCIGQMAELTGSHRRMPLAALDNFEEMLLRAAQVQADRPHRSTLPPAGEHVGSGPTGAATPSRSGVGLWTCGRPTWHRRPMMATGNTQLLRHPRTP
jgi:hypothetical protein